MQEAIDAALAAGIQPHRLTGWKCAAFVNFTASKFGSPAALELLKNWNISAILGTPETA